MCTVTYIFSDGHVFISSNRDEKAFRKQALPPQKYHHNKETWVYPKDADAGGTWIAMKDDGNVAVLLNGGFVGHTPNPPYAKSRGMVFLDIMYAVMPVKKFLRYNLNNIEPFTLILFCDHALFECRWDGTKKYNRQLDPGQYHIWSSATLYDDVIVKRRESWFEQWMQKYPSPSQNEILQFHQFAGGGDTHNSLRMNRDGKVYTVSVTGIELYNDKAVMQYLDLTDNKSYRQELTLSFAGLKV